MVQNQINPSKAVYLSLALLSLCQTPAYATQHLSENPAEISTSDPLPIKTLPRKPATDGDEDGEARITDAETGITRLPERASSQSPSIIPDHLKFTQETAIIISDTGFTPSTLSVSRGVTIHLTLTGVSKTPLCFILEEFGIRKQVKSNQVTTASFTPEKEGIYRFHCPINGASGKIIVLEEHVGPDLLATLPLERLRQMVAKLENLSHPGSRKLASNSTLIPGRYSHGSSSLSTSATSTENTGPLLGVPLTVQVGPRFFSHWKFWQAPTVYIPQSFTVDAQLGIAVLKILEPYLIFGKTLINDSASNLMYFGGGAKVKIYSLNSSAHLYGLLDFAYYTQTPELPVPQEYLSSPLAIRFGGGIKWYLGKESKIFLDGSAVLFKPNQGFYIGPTVAIGAEF